VNRLDCVGGLVLAFSGVTLGEDPRHVELLVGGVIG